MIKQAKTLIDSAVSQLREFQLGKNKPLKTGISHLDENMLGGLFSGNIVVIGGTSGCVDNKTEFFNGSEWKPISEYVDSDKVLQYNLDGSSTLVTPTKYHKYKVDTLWHIKTKYGLNQVLCDSHNVVYQTDKKNLFSKSMLEVRTCHKNNVAGFSGKFYTSWVDEGSFVPDLSENDFRFLIAVQADSSLVTKSTSRMRFNLKKERKKERLRGILKTLVLENKEFKWREDKKNTGYSEFIVWTSPKFFTKDFPVEWYNLRKDYKEIFKDEILEWDGYKPENTYFTTNKPNADLVQFIFSSLGFRSRLTVDNRPEKCVCYQVNFTVRNMVGMASNENKCKISEYKNHDGYKYCFSVPSKMLILRREGCIFVTGNSGKSYMLQKIENNILNPKFNKDYDKVVLLRCNFEMSTFKLLLRKLKTSLNKSLKSIIFEAPSEEESSKFKKICDEERNPNIYYLEEPPEPTEWYKSMQVFLEEHKDKKQVVVTVDHISLYPSSSGDKKKAIDAVIEYMNLLKREFKNVSFIVLCQLNREIEGRTDPRFMQPRRSDLYQSDTIFQIADIVLVTHNPYRLGISKYMVVNQNRYEYLTEHKVTPSNNTSNFHTNNRIFFHYLKIREIEDMEDIRDLYIEMLDSTSNSSTKNLKVAQEPLNSLIDEDEDEVPF